MSNGMFYSTINLNSNNREITKRIELNGPQILTIQGPGSLMAPVSGPSNVTIRVVNCEFNNKTRVSYPQNAIGYVLEGADTDLLFSNQYYPTNRVRGALITAPNFPDDLLWEQLSRANREAIQPLSNSAVFSRQFIISSVGSSPSVSLPGSQ